MAIEVSGGLRNPFVLGPVVLWSLLLLLLSGFAAKTWLRSRRAVEPVARGRGVALVSVAGLFYLLTPVAIFIGATALYMMESIANGGHYSSVGFWGGPWTIAGWVLPPWLAGLGGWIYAVRRHRRI